MNGHYCARADLNGGPECSAKVLGYARKLQRADNRDRRPEERGADLAKKRLRWDPRVQAGRMEGDERGCQVITLHCRTQTQLANGLSTEKGHEPSRRAPKRSSRPCFRQALPFPAASLPRRLPYPPLPIFSADTARGRPLTNTWLTESPRRHRATRSQSRSPHSGRG